MANQKPVVLLERYDFCLRKLANNPIKPNRISEECVENAKLSTYMNVKTCNVIYSEDDDDSIADPDFIPENGSSESSLSENSDDIRENVDIEADCQDSTLTANNNQEVQNVASKTNNKNIIPEFEREKLNTYVEASNLKKKNNFCIYCKRKVSHFARHLERVHKEESEVRSFTCLPKRCPERLKIIEIIRKRGNFQYNLDSNYNKGDAITMRRPVQLKTSDNYICCPKCLGFYSKISLRKHYKQCCSQKSQSGRTVMMMGRRVQCDLSSLANDVVKNHIFPVLRDDEIIKPLRYDNLVITYANKMTLKYRKPHNYAMIRTRIRLIGRLLSAVKKLDPTIESFADIYRPINYDTVIKAVNSVAQLDTEGRKYKAPSTASSAGTLLKKCGNIYITELIKQQDKNRKIEVEDFLKLLQVDYGIVVNKTVTETQLENKRHKKILLPSMYDIRLLNCYLTQNRRKYFNKVIYGVFSIQDYKNLQSFTMISAQVFNRRRAGEIQRIEINDFKNYQTIDKNTDQDVFQSLSDELRKATQDYVRFTIRGKLGREVPVLLYRELVSCIKLIIEKRSEVGVLEENPYIFAIPGSENKTHEACNLMRIYSLQCGANLPASLRGTCLRKHVATHSVIYNLSENEVSDLANFMGHAEKIHREHYRIPIATRDITRMSQLLEKAQGGLADEGSDIEEDNNNNRGRIEYVKHSNNEDKDAYFDNVTNVDNEEKSTEDLCNSSNRRSTSPLGSVQRRSWEFAEINCVKKCFRKYLAKGYLPSLDKCQEAVTTHHDLRKRSPMQLKLWISNQIRKEKGVTLLKKYDSPKHIKRVRWSTPERLKAADIFQCDLRNKTLPSLHFCREIIKKYPVFKNRTATQLKLWVNNQVRKETKL